MKTVIKTETLTKKFGESTAVDGISLEIREGEVFGLLGPNGAGKTTTISMLCTLLSPTGGRAWVNGFDIVKQESQVRKSIGIVFQDPSIDDELTARENLEMHGRLYGMESEQMKKRIDEVLRLVELQDRANDLMKTYSSGMRRRLEIARGLMHRPKVLFLDEPTLGLDPQTRAHIWDYLKMLNEKEKITVLITTHYMEEADLLCDRAGIIDRGRIIALGSPAKLKEGLEGDVIRLKVAGECRDRMLQKLKRTKSVKKTECFDNSINITVRNADKALLQILEAAKEEGIKVNSIELHKPTLNDVFLHFTGREIRADEAEGSGMMKRMRYRTRR